MTVVVYLGPTMSWSAAREILPHAVFRPPAAQSDIISVVDELSPTGILLIDGVFTQALSVWHKEILYALERGVAVYGSSSMGALRVAETAAYGARGFGEIFAGYASGELTDDDDVAVMHAGAEWDYRALSDAMVNIRPTLRRALAAGLLTAEQHDLLAEAAKRRFYPERSYGTMLADAGKQGLPGDIVDALRDFIRTDAVDQKRIDAITLLSHVAEHGVEPPDPIRVTRSHPFEAMYHRDRRVRRDAASLSLADIGSYAALHLPDGEATNEHALHAGLVDVLGELLKVEPGEAEVAAELVRFRAERRLRTEEDLLAWRRDNDLNEDDFDGLIHRLAVRRALRNWYVSRKYLERTTEDVLDELRLRGRYSRVADDAAAQHNLLESAHPDLTEQASQGELLALIRDQARSTGWRPTVGLDVWAFEHGFKDVYDVQYELVRARLAREATQAAMAALLTASEPDRR